MLIPIYSPIRLLTNRYLENGVKKGDYGVVIEVYDDAYEVEFMDEKGNTIDWFSVKPDEIELDESKNKPMLDTANNQTNNGTNSMLINWNLIYITIYGHSSTSIIS